VLINTLPGAPKKALAKINDKGFARSIR